MSATIVVDREHAAPSTTSDESHEDKSVHENTLTSKNVGCLRGRFVSLMEHPWFDRFVLFTILVNCGSMAAVDPLCSGFFGDGSPCDAFCDEIRPHVNFPDHECRDSLASDCLELTFTIIFSVEAFIKLVALGVMPTNPLSYFRNAWNWIDFVVVAVAWFTYLPFRIPNMAVLRSVRILKPLRTINRIPSMRILVGAMMSSIRGMVDVFLMLLIFFFVACVYGVHMFRRVLRQQCMLPVGASALYSSLGLTDSGGSDILCMDDSSCPDAVQVPLNVVWAPVPEDTPRFNVTAEALMSGLFEVPKLTSQLLHLPHRHEDEPVLYEDIATLVGPWVVLPSTCRSDDGVHDNENPQLYFGSISFDNFLYSLLLVCQCITLEGWSDVMYHLMQTVGKAHAVLFMCPVVIIGAFFIINLALAVVSSNYGDTRSQDEHEHPPEDEDATDELCDAAPEWDHIGKDDCCISEAATGQRVKESLTRLASLPSVKLPTVAEAGTAEVSPRSPTSPRQSQRDSETHNADCDSGDLPTSAGLPATPIDDAAATHTDSTMGANRAGTSSPVIPPSRASSVVGSTDLSLTPVPLPPTLVLPGTQPGHPPTVAASSPVPNSTTRHNADHNNAADGDGSTPTAAAATVSAAEARVNGGAGTPLDPTTTHSEHPNTNSDHASQHAGDTASSTGVAVALPTPPAARHHEREHTTGGRHGSAPSTPGCSPAPVVARSSSADGGGDVELARVCGLDESAKGRALPRSSPSRAARLSEGTVGTSPLYTRTSSFDEPSSATSSRRSATSPKAKEAPTNLSGALFGNRRRSTVVTAGPHHNEVPEPWYRRFAQKIEGTNAFTFTILGLIVFNSIVLAIDFHDQRMFEENYRTLFLEKCHDLFPSNYTLLSEETVTNTHVFDLRLHVSHHPVILDHSQHHECRHFVDRTILVQGMPLVLSAFTETCNDILMVIFALEMVIKLAANGAKGYIADRFNIFDAVLVVVSLLESVLLAIFGENGALSAGSGTFLVLRALRLFRVFKLARSWTSLRIILGTVQKSLSSLGPLLLILVIFMFMMSLVGMQVFGGLFYFDGSVPRSNFDSFFPSDSGYGAFFTVFQILTGENWNSVMYNGMRAAGPAVALFFVFMVVAGIYFIMNLFLAVLLDGFSTTREDISDRFRRATVTTTVVDDRRISNGAYQIISSMTRKPMKAYAWNITDYEKPVYHRRESWLRHRSRVMMQSPAFDTIFLLLVIANTAAMITGHPLLDPNSALAATLGFLEVFFIAVFTFEMLVKIAALGLWFGPDAYLRDGWNVLDFIIVLSSLINIPFRELLRIRVLRNFQALRPLRIVNRVSGLKLVVNCILRSIPPVANVLMVCFLFFVIFSIMGVQFFKGGFYRCLDPGTRLVDGDFVEVLPNGDPVMDWLDCHGAGGQWAAYPVNFDNIFVSFLTLFEVASLEGWLDVLNNGLDFRGPGMAMVKMSSPFFIIFFAFFVLAGAYFTLNLFVGVVIDNFCNIRSNIEMPSYLTAAQRRWVDNMRTLPSARPNSEVSASPSSWRYVFFKVSKHKAFVLSIRACIIINLLFNCTLTADSTNEWEETLDTLDVVFFGIFSLELLVRALGSRVRVWVLEPWNRLDMLLIFGSIFQVMVVSELPLPRSFKVFSYLRVLRFLRWKQGLRELVYLFSRAGMAMVNVSILLVLILVVFSLLCLDLFYNVQRQQFITEYANMDTFFNAFLLLLRAVTGENWPGIMHDCAAGLCLNPDDPDGCGHSAAALIVFISFAVVSMLVMINLFVAVLLDNFGVADPSLLEDGPHGLIREFNAVWDTFVSKGSKFLPFSSLEPFLRALPRHIFPIKSCNLWHSEYMRFLRTSELMMDDTERLLHHDIIFAVFHRLAVLELTAPVANRTFKFLGMAIARPKYQQQGERAALRHVNDVIAQFRKGQRSLGNRSVFASLRFSDVLSKTDFRSTATCTQGSPLQSDGEEDWEGHKYVRSLSPRSRALCVSVTSPHSRSLSRALSRATSVASPLPPYYARAEQPATLASVFAMDNSGDDEVGDQSQHVFRDGSVLTYTKARVAIRSKAPLTEDHHTSSEDDGDSGSPTFSWPGPAQLAESDSETAGAPEFPWVGPAEESTATGSDHGDDPRFSFNLNLGCGAEDSDADEYMRPPRPSERMLWEC